MAKYKVLVTRNDVPEEALSILREKCDLEIHSGVIPIPKEELCAKIKGKDAVFCLISEKIDSEVLDAAGNSLKVVGTMSVGVDHLSLDVMKTKGIKVGHTPGVLTDAVAELTIALLLSTSRRLFEANREMINGRWVMWAPLWMAGRCVSGCTVGIFGLGRIGQGVVQRLKTFNVKRFLYSGRSRKKEGDDLSAEYVSFGDLLKESDFIICTSALTDQTREIFDASAFRKMKKSAVFINTSRGGLVKQDDLIEALETGEIAAAGIDVMTPEPISPDHPLLSTKNLTVIPHIGSAELNTRIGMACLTSRNIVAALENRQMPAELC